MFKILSLTLLVIIYLGDSVLAQRQARYSTKQPKVLNQCKLDSDCMKPGLVQNNFNNGSPCCAQVEVIFVDKDT